MSQTWALGGTIRASSKVAFPENRTTGESSTRCNINMWVSLEQFFMRERRCRGRGLTCCLQLPADTCKHLLVSRRDSYICLYSTCPVVSGRDSYICLYHACPGVLRGNLREPCLHTPGDVQQLPYPSRHSSTLKNSSAEARFSESISILVASAGKAVSSLCAPVSPQTEWIYNHRNNLDWMMQGEMT